MSQRFKAITDNYKSLDDLQAALLAKGVSNGRLVVAIDFTKSNEDAGLESFGGRSLHCIGATPNPYEQVIGMIGRALHVDAPLQCYGFGDELTCDGGVFAFHPDDAACESVDAMLSRYRHLAPHVQLAGPTSFAPAVNQAVSLVINSGCEHHVLLIIADGQVTRSSDTPAGALSPQEEATVQAIIEASGFPLSIIMVGVGDGPWGVMAEYDDALEKREFDNFQFVNFTHLHKLLGRDPELLEKAVVLQGLMELPAQVQHIQDLAASGVVPPSASHTFCEPMPPPYCGARAATPPGGRRPGSASGPVTILGQSPPPSRSTSAVAPAAPGVDPSLFMCPILQDFMTDPVITADGQCYDRSAIEGWFATHVPPTSPLTNQPLAHANLTPIYALRCAIQEYRAKNNV